MPHTCPACRNHESHEAPRTAASSPAVAELFVPENNTLERYLELRAEFNELVGAFDPAKGHMRRASVFAYLNRHCFNGLCRYNRSGGFNAHFGFYAKPRWMHDSLVSLRTRLAPATFVCADWRETMETARTGDIVYCDPPYLKTFSQYSRDGFGFDDHTELAKRALALAERGVRVVVSNSLEAELLYPDAKVDYLVADRRISCTTAGRGKTRELIAVFEPR